MRTILFWIVIGVIFLVAGIYSALGYRISTSRQRF
jgi:hypothetical protein